MGETMHFFVIRIQSTDPTVGSEKGSEAFVSCWVNDPIRNIALDKATKRIRGLGWNVIEIVEDYPISRDDYLLKPEGLEYYDQAIIDGEVLVFFIPKHESGMKSAHA